MPAQTRDEFRCGVFQRDDSQCVICSEAGQDAHHLIERRLWDDGGYHLDNGVTLCGQHHILAEQTLLSVEELREAAGITKVVLPAHLYRDHRYDKWGNVILANGQRARGELFDDESVQKALAQTLHLFTPYIKYPRTYHLPWSPGCTADDRVLTDTSFFEGKEVVVTVKMDGENTTMYSDHIHARSIDSANHPSRNWVKGYHAKVAYQIPSGWRVCGENLFAAHSIRYSSLPSYFLAFSIWDEFNRCLSWDDTLEWCELLELQSVPVLYRGVWSEEEVRKLATSEYSGNECEGYVVRVANSFSYGDFRKAMAKYVRAGHVKTSHHWRFAAIRQNHLTSG